MLLIDGSSKTGLFRHFPKHVLGVHNMEIQKSMTVIFFFLQNVQDLIQISKIQQKNEKKIFVSEIIASQFGSLNFLC